MNIRKILGILLFLGGLGMLGASFYINTQVIQGKQQIAEGQRKVDRAKTPFSLTPITQPIGGALTKSGQGKIDNGQQQVDYYEMLAAQLQMGGIIAAIAGLGLFIFGFSGSSRKK